MDRKDLADTQLQGRVAIVTGAAGGIGRATVRELLEKGVRVVATDIDVSALTEDVRDELGNGMVKLLAADLCQMESYPEIVDAAVGTYGRLDILINNAATIERMSIADVDEVHWGRLMTVNLKAAFFLSKLAVVPMRKAGWGRIINLSSQAGHSGGQADCPVYAITKGGIFSMTRSFARAYAKDGITVNTVAPGIVMTKMIRETLPEKKIQALIQEIPIGRTTKAEEIATTIVFLAMPEAASITGHTVDINGGMLMR